MRKQHFSLRSGAKPLTCHFDSSFGFEPISTHKMLIRLPFSLIGIFVFLYEGAFPEG